MAERDLWVGRCHVKARYPEARQWSAAVDEAVLVAVVTASDAATGQALVAQRLEEAGLDLLTFEHVQTLLQRFREQGMSQPLVDLADRTSTASPVAFGEMLPILLEPPAAPAPQEAAPPPAPTYTEIGWDDLFGATQPPLWAVIDGVNCREVMARLAETDVQSACLYASTDADTRAMAPWLVRLEPDSELVSWLKGLPQDQHWGILLQSTATLKQLRTHLRKFTMLWTPANDQAPVYFRFYDPRVALELPQVLPEWKSAQWLALIDTLTLPISPSMTWPDDLSLVPGVTFASERDICQGRLIQIALPHRQGADAAPSRRFAITRPEFDDFSRLQRVRAQRGLARNVLEEFTETSPDEVLAAVDAAQRLGQRHGMTSKKQVTTLTKCLMEFGDDFPRDYPEAGRLLTDGSSLAWQRRNHLEAWRPRGRLQRDFLARQPISDNELEAWPSTHHEPGRPA
ncbi:DUF4123 domain-containing protein [Halomonas sp. THAF12]|uniref:DUF4123 domain-containing protein n=1 Tax=Halomonas sp. B23F22_10 TaxID=3459515 RepID=UPI00373EBDC1